MESLWSLINQDEFLFMSVFQDVPFIPKIYGSCGAYYVTEFAPPGQILSPSFFNAKKEGMWRKRVDIALGILEISSSLDIDFHEPLHFCDIKEENFGINSNNQVKILDTDSLFFDTSMMKDLADPKCKTHDDCDFFDCRGWCDVNTHQCVAKRTNNNIQVIYFCVKLGKVVYVLKTHQCVTKRTNNNIQVIYLCVNLDTVVHITHVFEYFCLVIH
jgi:hypothetical protein